MCVCTFAMERTHRRGWWSSISVLCFREKRHLCVFCEPANMDIFEISSWPLSDPLGDPLNCFVSAVTDSSGDHLKCFTSTMSLSLWVWTLGLGSLLNSGLWPRWPTKLFLLLLLFSLAVCHGPFHPPWFGICFGEGGCCHGPGHVAQSFVFLSLKFCYCLISALMFLTLPIPLYCNGFAVCIFRSYFSYSSHVLGYGHRGVMEASKVTSQQGLGLNLL